MNKNFHLSFDTGKTAGLNFPCFIAAEIGLNFNGDINLAFKMIEAAAEAGADGVKFQNYRTEDFLIDDKLSYTYFNNGCQIIESQWDLFKRCELKEEQLKALKFHCDKVGIEFFSTPTSINGIKVLEDLDVSIIKNGSDFLTNLALIRCMAKTGKMTVLSTGMATIGEIDDAVQEFKNAGGRDLILLHCTSAYPTPPSEVNLNRIPILAKTFGCLSGFSDHTEGIASAIGAVIKGACFIEKHFTLDNSLPGPDHRFSANPDQLRELVKGVRTAELALGSCNLGPTNSELSGRENFRLSCLSAIDLEAETTLKPVHIAIMRPGTGISPKHLNQLIGMTTKKKISRGHIFSWEDFK